MVFGDRHKDDAKIKRKGASFQDGGVTILTSGCHFQGKLHCRGSSRIGGKIEGDILSEGLLIIEEDAFIAANIKAEEVVVQGHVKGRLEASQRVELASQSRFEGDIVTPILVIMEGAQFNGQSTMTKSASEMKGLASTTSPALDRSSLKKDSLSLAKDPIPLKDAGSSSSKIGDISIRG